LHNLTSTVNKNYLIYKFKNNHIYSRLLKKWYRNYSYAAKLPFFAVHKNIYYYFLVLFLLLFSLTWNPYFVKTYEYGFFIPHLAKGSLLLIIIFYLIIRSIYFPLKKGMSFLSLFPFNFIKILIFSFLIDIVKTFAFVKARMNFK
jgi:hypothetical protein